MNFCIIFEHFIVVIAYFIALSSVLTIVCSLLLAYPLAKVEKFFYYLGQDRQCWC